MSPEQVKDSLPTSFLGSLSAEVTLPFVNKPGKLLLRVEDAHDDHRAGWYLPTPIVSTTPTPTPTPTEEGPTA